MNLDFQFRRLVFVQVLLGVIAFCIAERNPGLMLVAGSIVVLSRYLTEGPSNWHMPRWLTNILALGCVGWLIVDLTRQDGNVIIAMGHFMMWIQVLLLYTPQSNRDYGQLLVLSLMLMISASVLSVSMVYGILLAIYCVLGLWTVLRFQLKATADRVRDENRAAAPAGMTPPEPKPTTGRGYRWHLRVIAVYIALVCGTVAVAVFVVMPRQNESYLPKHLSEPLKQVQAGFDDKVDLNTSPSGNAPQQPVLNISISANDKNRGKDGVVWLLRGAVLDHYDPASKQWRRAGSLAAESTLKLKNNEITLIEPSPLDYLAQITVRQTGHNNLFTMLPLAYVASENLSAVTFNPIDQQLEAEHALSAGGVYKIRWPLLPPPKLGARYREKLTDDQSRPLPPRSSSYARGWPVQSQRIATLTSQVLQARELSRDVALEYSPNDEDIVYALADFLRENYSYSLENPAARVDDPVVAFLFSHHQGHCELFASALAAMCRSINIPARVVTGYRVAEYNRIGGYYIVRESDAHAWCEIDFGPEIGWRSVDATPPEDVEAEHQTDASYWRAAREVYDYLEFYWLKAVVRYDPTQRTEVLETVSQGLRDSIQGEDAMLGTLAETIQGLPRLWRLDRLNYTIAGVITICIGLGILSLVRTLVIRRRRLTALQLTAMPRAKRRGLTRKLRFYLQMLDLLERNGYERSQWQSPYHFAQQLVGSDPQRFAPVLELTETFYEIRFGHRDPSPDVIQRIRDNLRKLEAAIIHRRPQVAQPAEADKMDGQ